MTSNKIGTIKELFKDPIGQLDYHIKLTDSMSGILVFLSWLFLLAIPLLSAIITLLVAIDNSSTGVGSPIFFLGACLSIFSTLNAVFKPANNFKYACSFRSKFGALKRDIKRKTELTEDPEELEKFLIIATRETEKIVNEYNQWLSSFLNQWNDSDK